MADPVVTYPFDPTGQASTNRVVGEEIVVLPPGDRLFHYAMPKLAPFFGKNLIVKLRDLNNNVIPLTEGVDYYLTHKFMDASLATMHAIYGSISFLKRDIVGTLLVDYNHLGGIWTIDSATMAEILLNRIQNPRITTWEQVVERPIDFPVIDHPWNLDDMVGQKEILEMMDKFYLAYLASLDPAGGGGGIGIITEHIRNKDNPHEVTAAQVGAYTKQEVTALLLGYLAVNGTAADSNKLGGFTYAQVAQQILATKIANAVYADNAGVANSAVVAQNALHFEGVSLDELMQRIRVSAVSSADRLNGLLPSEVKADILSGKAADSGKLEGKTLAAIKAELQAATGDATSLQGKSLVQLMADVKTTKVDNAVSADNSVRFNNMTFTEASAAILLGQAADALKLGGKSLDQIKAELQAATGDATSLQGKSLLQLMADVKSTKVDTAAQADNATRFANKSYVEVAADILSGQAADSLKLGGKTLAEIKQEVQAATSDAATLQGKSLTQLMADVKTTKVDSATSADNALRFNNLTYSQLVEAVLAGQAADSLKLGGRTFQEVVDAVKQGGIDASSLQGKTLLALMADVKTTLVDRALVASDSELLGGATLASIMNSINTLKPALASDSEKVYGYAFNELVTNILSSSIYRNTLTHRFAVYNLLDAVVQSPGNGGNQDQAYNYCRVGLILANSPVVRLGSVMKVSFYFDGSLIDLEINFSYSSATNDMELLVYSKKDLGSLFYFGKRYGDQFDAGGNATKYAELYIKYRKADAPRLMTVFQQTRNDFQTPVGPPDIWDNTFNILNDVVWVQANKSNDVILLTTAVQKAFDDTADAITALIQQPAA